MTNAKEFVLDLELGATMVHAHVRNLAGEWRQQGFKRSTPHTASLDRLLTVQKGICLRLHFVECMNLFQGCQV